MAERAAYPHDLLNEWSVPSTAFVCEDCGQGFIVTPAVPEDKWGEWTGCQSEDCDSYEPTRDGDLYLGLGMVEQEAKP